jgi:hypothetical protein
MNECDKKIILDVIWYHQNIHLNIMCVFDIFRLWEKEKFAYVKLASVNNAFKAEFRGTNWSECDGEKQEEVNGIKM